jgi:hypothetical protein
MQLSTPCCVVLRRVTDRIIFNAMRPKVENGASNSSADRPAALASRAAAERGTRPTRAHRSRQRSRVANGSELVPGVDQRSVWVRRAKEQLADFISDLGGIDNTSAAERGIVRRAAVLGVELERMEKAFAEAGQANPDEIELYARVSGNYRRLLESVGLQRRAKRVLDLDDYLTSLPPEGGASGDAPHP